MTETDSKLKTRVLELLTQVPSPPEKPLPEGTRPEVLRAAELKYGIKFPPKLRDWLLASNGACVGPGGMVGVGCSRPSGVDLELVYEDHPNWRDKGWVPVADDGFGNYYVVATREEYGSGEPVFFMDIYESTVQPSYIVASDVWHFLNFALSRELEESNWPFDKTEVLESDPNIISFTNISLPWLA